jgi:hypothetical protein
VMRAETPANALVENDKGLENEDVAESWLRKCALCSHSVPRQEETALLLRQKKVSALVEQSENHYAKTYQLCSSSLRQL